MEGELRELEFDYKSASIETVSFILDEAEDETAFEEIFSACGGRTDVIQLLYDHAETPDDVRAKAAKLLTLPVPTSTAVALRRDESRKVKAAEPEEKKAESLVKRLQKLTIGQKIAVAKKGNSSVRKVLGQESNKMIIMAVLDNPKISVPEIEMMARSRNVPNEALTHIARNKHWVKNYSVINNLVSNPKTPAGVAMKFVTHLSKKDLAQLEKNKSVSEAVRSTAKKLVKGSIQ